MCVPVRLVCLDTCARLCTRLPVPGWKKQTQTQYMDIQSTNPGIVQSQYIFWAGYSQTSQRIVEVTHGDWEKFMVLVFVERYLQPPSRNIVQ